MIRVAITYYPDCAEKTLWTEMPAVPHVGDVVFIPGWRSADVRRVYWDRAEDGWYAELHCD